MLLLERSRAGAAERLRLHMKNEILLGFQEHWSKCPFCGASRGLYGRPLEQHTPRCRYKGDANTNDVSVPNYEQMIEEHDRTYLPMMHAFAVLPPTQAKLKAAIEVGLKFEELSDLDDAKALPAFRAFVKAIRDQRKKDEKAKA